MNTIMLCPSEYPSMPKRHVFVHRIRNDNNKTVYDIEILYSLSEMIKEFGDRSDFSVVKKNVFLRSSHFITGLDSNIFQPAEKCNIDPIWMINYEIRGIRLLSNYINPIFALGRSRSQKRRYIKEYEDSNKKIKLAVIKEIPNKAEEFLSGNINVFWPTIKKVMYKEEYIIDNKPKEEWYNGFINAVINLTKMLPKDTTVDKIIDEINDLPMISVSPVRH